MSEQQEQDQEKQTDIEGLARESFAPPPPEEKQQSEPQTYEQRQEEKARSQGWKPLEEWEGNEDDWVDARDFNIRGEFISKIKNYEQQLGEVDSRIANLNQVHQARMEQTVKDLLAQKKVALENHDAQLVDDLNSQIQAAQVPQQQPPMEHESQKLLNEWNANNTWVNEDTPKASRAHMVYQREIVKPGATMAQVLKAVNDDVAKNFPETPKISTTEGGSKPKGKGPAKKALTMDDVSAEEMKLRNAFPHWKDEKVFLKAIEDSRKEK